ncbi:MAG: STAS domain-containing protein [Gammaproteobacteria bacterium]|nr:STAS domain-containing protein [Gammaproteobacteria bacterium]MCP5417358.1 STAS domain-containing protein [Chromatiaceae bacterium]
MSGIDDADCIPAMNPELSEGAVTRAEIVRTGEGRFQVSGDLVFATVPALLQKAAPLLAQSRVVTLDLAAVGHCDSAGLALLLEWVATGASVGQRISFLNLPEALVGIARLSNAESLLPTA